MGRLMKISIFFALSSVLLQEFSNYPLNAQYNGPVATLTQQHGLSLGPQAKVMPQLSYYLQMTYSNIGVNNYEMQHKI